MKTNVLTLAVSMSLLGAGAADAAGGSMGSGSSGSQEPGAAPQYPTSPGTYAAGDQSRMPDYPQRRYGSGFGSSQGAPGYGGGGPTAWPQQPGYGQGPAWAGSAPAGEDAAQGEGQAQAGPARTGPYGGRMPPYGYGPPAPYGYRSGMPDRGYAMPGYGQPRDQGGQQGAPAGGNAFRSRPEAGWDQGLPWYGWPGSGPRSGQQGQGAAPTPSRGGLYPYRSPFGVQMEQTEEGYEFLVPIKGVPSEQVTVEVRGRQLLVARDESISRSTERPGEGGYGRSYSYSFGSFRRSLTIPRDADPSGMTYESTEEGIKILLPRKQ